MRDDFEERELEEHAVPPRPDATRGFEGPACQRQGNGYPWQLMQWEQTGET